MHRQTLVLHVPGWSTLGDQIGPVDIRGARPLHSGCCEAVLECASHAVDSRIFGSMPPFQKNKYYFPDQTCSCNGVFNLFIVVIFFLLDKRDSPDVASRAPLAERSAVNRQVLGSIPSGGVLFFFAFAQREQTNNRFYSSWI